MMNSTLCYIKNDRNEYLLLHRTKKENDLNEGKWIGVGGKFEEGESADECLIREVYEETGLTLTDYHLHGIIKFVSDTWEDEDMYLYSAEGFTGDLKEDCDEGDLLWVPKDRIPDLPTWEGDRLFLTPLLNGRKRIDMLVRYEGEKLVEWRDLTEDINTLKSALITCPHGFSTRTGGVSDGMFSTLNLGMNRGDEPARVTENWRRFLESAGIKQKSFVCGKQVHENTVCIVDEKDLRPAYGKGEMNVCDGYVTNRPQVPLAIFTADCVPLLLHDKRAGIAGAVHCGWRSTVADIEKNAVDAFVKLGSSPGDICAAIGPAIDSCCFEVGGEVIEAVKDLTGEAAERYYTPRDDKFMLDLRGVVAHRLVMLGVRQENIDITGECTMCHPEKYFSHRGTKGNRGSLASVIMLNS
ncbi:MAG: peptidoglycan editing factor PgeF [Lachnospiraceae bacterium]|nr:peptidoglycan editing factor PgeF [Lachnospiraceae bacterium]